MHNPRLPPKNSLTHSPHSTHDPLLPDDEANWMHEHRLPPEANPTHCPSFMRDPRPPDAEVSSKELLEDVAVVQWGNKQQQRLLLSEDEDSCIHNPRLPNAEISSMHHPWPPNDAAISTELPEDVAFVQRGNKQKASRLRDDEAS